MVTPINLGQDEFLPVSRCEEEQLLGDLLQVAALPSSSKNGKLINCHHLDVMQIKYPGLRSQSDGQQERILSTTLHEAKAFSPTYLLLPTTTTPHTQIFQALFSSAESFINILQKILIISRQQRLSECIDIARSLCDQDEPELYSRVGEAAREKQMGCWNKDKDPANLFFSKKSISNSSISE